MIAREIFDDWGIIVSIKSQLLDKKSADLKNTIELHAIKNI